MPAIIFDPVVFVQAGYELADGDWAEEKLRQVERLRAQHPELQHWGTLAIGCAWGDYSQDIMAVSWLYEKQMDCSWYNLDFLAYIYVHQLAPAFDFWRNGVVL